jgi:hypothetical protein
MVVQFTDNILLTQYKAYYKERKLFSIFVYIIENDKFNVEHNI